MKKALLALLSLLLCFALFACTPDDPNEGGNNDQSQGGTNPGLKDSTDTPIIDLELNN